MDSIGNSAGVLCVFIANGINIAVGFAAALLRSETIFCQSTLNAIEAILQTRVDCIETITQTIGNATKLSIYVLVVEAFE